MRTKILLLSLAAALSASALQAQTNASVIIADGTAIPVKLTASIDTAKAKPGDTISAKTMQVVHAANHVDIPRGSVVTGHILSVTPHNDAAGQSAGLAIEFNQISVNGQTRSKAQKAMLPVRFTLRALASSYDAYQSENLTLPESQAPYTHAMIGGGETNPGSKFLYSPGGDKIGYENKEGRFGALQASAAQPGSSLTCQRTTEAQSLAIFAPSACGIYGFDHVELTQNTDGAIALTARQHNIALYAGSALLLQVKQP